LDSRLLLNERVLGVSIGQQQWLGPATHVLTAFFGNALSASNALPCLPDSVKLKVDTESHQPAAADAPVGPTVSWFLSPAAICGLLLSSSARVEARLADAVSVLVRAEFPEASQPVGSQAQLSAMLEKQWRRANRSAQAAADLLQAANSVRALQPRDTNCPAVQAAAALTVDKIGRNILKPGLERFAHQQAPYQGGSGEAERRSECVIRWLRPFCSVFGREQVQLLRLAELPAGRGSDCRSPGPVRQQHDRGSQPAAALGSDGAERDGGSCILGRCGL